MRLRNYLRKIVICDDGKPPWKVITNNRNRLAWALLALTRPPVRLSICSAVTSSVRASAPPTAASESPLDGDVTQI